MAHQAHIIPWDRLASNLEWREAESCKDKKTNLHFRYQPDQKASINAFVAALARAIEECADRERLKYPAEYTVPSSPDEIVISDDVARRILPTVRKLRQESELWDHNGVVEEKVLCQHQKIDDSQHCLCSLPYSQRRMKAFLRQHEDNDCLISEGEMDETWQARRPHHVDCHTFYTKNLESFLNLEIVKALLIHGEFDSILRICSNPEVGLKGWWEELSCYCRGADVGWELIYQNALQSYILLNLLFHFPDTWDWESSASDSQMDYRRSSAYQVVVNSTTLSGQYSEVVQFPHRFFFGISFDQFHYHPSLKNPEHWPQHTTSKSPHLVPFGEMSYDEFLACEETVSYLPSKSDILFVHWIFRWKLGLPTEIVDLILSEAEYDCPLRQLPVPHHPFHKDNSYELRRYIGYCWELIVGCEMMARAMDLEMSWAEAVDGAVHEFCFCMCKGASGRFTRTGRPRQSPVPGKYRRYQETWWPWL